MISKKELLEETCGTLKPIKEFRSGLLVYNKPHFKDNFIYITTDVDKIKERVRNGWLIYPGKYKFILRAPEVVLCDLSEIHTNPTRNPKEILTLFKILNRLNSSEYLKKIIVKYFKNLEVIPLRGPYSTLEIRVAGSDRRVYKIPQILYHSLKETNLWKTELKKTEKTLKNREFCLRIKKLQECSRRTKNFYTQLVKQYSNFEKISFPNIAVYGFWRNLLKYLPKNTIYIFVPKTGLKYTFGFIEEIGSFQQIMLWECHLSLDMTKELRIFDKKLKNKKVALIDRSYSSNTLDYLGDKVRAEGGDPIKFALFPKSKRAIQHSDYFLFLDKFIRSNAIQFKENWLEELFVKVVNNDLSLNNN